VKRTLRRGRSTPPRGQSPWAMQQVVGKHEELSRQVGNDVDFRHVGRRGTFLSNRPVAGAGPM